MPHRSSLPAMRILRRSYSPFATVSLFRQVSLLQEPIPWIAPIQLYSSVRSSVGEKVSFLAPGKTEAPKPHAGIRSRQTAPTSSTPGMNVRPTVWWTALRLYVRPLSPLALQTDSSWACPGDSVSLSISYSGGAPPYIFSWWDGNTDPNRRFPSDSSFRPAFQLGDACGQFARDTAVVHIPDPVLASFAALEDPASTLRIQISNYSRNGLQFYWDLGDGNSSTVSQPKHTYSRAGTYIIQLRTTDRLGCSDSTWQTIEVRQEYSLFVPTAFTPNGDRINDLFVIQGSGIRSFVFRVFNRWGEQIFRSGSITPFLGRDLQWYART